MKRKLISTAAILFTMGAASSVYAQDAAQLPQVQTSGEVAYVSGGIGLEERARLRSLAVDDNLELSFAMENGHYLGAAEVSIKDNNGKEVLEAVSDGPLFFAKLPAGRYVIEATAMGKTITRAVNVASKGQTQIFFSWAGSDRSQSTS
jgi:hypothetical protein